MGRVLKAIEVRVPRASESFVLRFGVNSKNARIESIERYTSFGDDSVDALVWFTDESIDDIEGQKRIAGSLEQRLIFVRWTCDGEGSVPVPSIAGSFVGRFRDQEGQDWVAFRCASQPVADVARPSSPVASSGTSTGRTRAQAPAAVERPASPERASAQSGQPRASGGSTTAPRGRAPDPAAGQASGADAPCHRHPSEGIAPAQRSQSRQGQSPAPTRAPGASNSDAQSSGKRT